MLKDTLLKGRGAGAPLFLAWTAGAFIAFGLLQTSVFVDDTLNVRWFLYVSFFVCLGLLSTWQGILLFQTRLRRTAWVLLYAGVILTVIFFEAAGVRPPSWFSFDWTTA